MAKHLLLMAAAVWFLVAPGVLAGSPGEAEPAGLSSLRQEYLHKRAEALKPVQEWYKLKLEAAQKAATQAGDLDGALVVRRELEELRQTSGTAAGLAQALVANTWSWTDQPSEKGVQMTFQEDGLVSHIGMRGTWLATGLREVTISPEGGAPIVLRFDSDVRTYHQVGGKIHGRRWK